LVDVVGQVGQNAFGVQTEGCGDELGVDGVDQVDKPGAVLRLTS